MNQCIDVRVLIPEAALELLSGTDRAEVLDHLETCEACRELMHELSAVADDLVLLSPNGEPPSGFEQRVLARIGPLRPRRRWPVVVGSIVAALLAVVAFGAGRAMGGSTSSVREVEMRAPSGEVVGDAYLHGDDPTWVFVAVPGWSAANEYRLRVTFTDGTTTDVAGSRSWGSVLPVDTHHIRELALVGADGRVWCAALLPT